MIIKEEDMLDTTQLKLEDVAKAFTEKKNKDIVEDDEEIVNETEIEEDVEIEDKEVEKEIDDETEIEEDTNTDDETEIEEDTDEDPDVEDEEDEEEIEDDEPELDENKANEAQLSAFAEMKRQKKKAEQRAQEIEETYKEIDKEFAKLAKDSGFDDIGSAEDYLRALRNQRRTTEYKKTNDPSIMAEMVADSLSQRQKTADKNRNDNVSNDTPSSQSEDLIGMILEFNKEYDQDVRSVDDIARLPNAEQIIDLMGATYKDKDGNTKSLSLKDAYMIANKDEVLSSRSAKKSSKEKEIKQNTINKMKGHNHLKTTTKKSGKVEKIKVKRSELNKWREMFPEKSDKQAIKEIKMYKKNGHVI